MADLGTELDISHLAPETRAAAVRYLERSGNADVAEILGLAPATAPPGTVLVDGVTIHAACGRPMPKSGRCRQRQQCRDQERGAQ